MRYDATFTGDPDRAVEELEAYRDAVKRAADRLEMEQAYEDVMSPDEMASLWGLGRDADDGPVTAISVYGGNEEKITLRYRYISEPRYWLTVNGGEPVRDVLSEETGESFEETSRLSGLLRDLRYDLDASVWRGDGLL